MDCLVRTLNALFGELTHRDQSIKARLDFHKCTEVGQLDDLAFDEVALCVLLCLFDPRIRKGILDREGDTLRIAIHALYVDVELLPNLEHL